MSLMIDGRLQQGWLDEETENGEFVRRESTFRNWITADGSAGPSGSAGFRAEAGRYHLYVSLACPWAHRTLIFRHLKGLRELISVSVVHPDMGAAGWRFDEYPGSTPDHVNGFRYMHEVYTQAQPDFTGIVTVPVLWDKHTGSIVNNESSEIIRMFNSAFDGLTGLDVDYYPTALRDEIDRVNAMVYDNINNGVYRAGFATSQAAYEKAVNSLFAALDKIEHRLSENRYLVGSVLTEADWRLFTTLIRFDAVYYSHFKCNIRRIEDYPSLSNYMRELFQIPGIADTVNLDQIKRHYYYSHDMINPTGIVPLGPELDFSRAHNRSSLC